jgi:hypothetical protein
MSVKPMTPSESVAWLLRECDRDGAVRFVHNRLVRLGLEPRNAEAFVDQIELMELERLWTAKK